MTRPKPSSDTPKPKRKRIKDREPNLPAFAELMRKQGWTPHDLAVRSGVSEKSIRRMLDGETYPHRKTAEKLERSLKGFTKEPLFESPLGFEPANGAAASTDVRMPSPRPPFCCFRIGRIELPIMPIAGSPASPFSMDEVVIRYEPAFLEQRQSFPRELAMSKHFLVAYARKVFGIERLEDNVLLRLSSVDQGPETARDQRGPLYLSFDLACYTTMLATNLCLDVPAIPTSPETVLTLRERFFSGPNDYRDLSNSPLANIPGVEVVVLCRSRKNAPPEQMLIRRRSQSVHGFRGFYQVSAAGYMSREHLRPDGLPCPFVTAVHEARQEIGDRLHCRPEEFNLLGVAIQWQSLHPSFFGWMETPLKATELIADFRRDAYEGLLMAIPFTPTAVLNHITSHRWTGMSALAVIATLQRFFPRSAVEDAASTVPDRNWQWFLEPFSIQSSKRS